MPEWWLVLSVIFAALIVLLAIGIPVAFAFLTINIVSVYIFWNGTAGFHQLVLSVSASVTHFSILPVPLFVLMGEVMFRSGIASKQMEVLDSWFGRIPGRLSLMAVGGGTMFATLTGSGMAGTAMLGKLLVPDMERRGYQKPMTLGPILGSGGLAIMIPPSALGVLLAAIGDFSVGEFLVAIIIPGLLMAVFYGTYIVIRCIVQPHVAPPYDIPPQPLLPKIVNTLIYVFPLVTIVFLVIGLILLGVATPTESAALGAAGTFVLAALYRGFSWRMVVDSLESTLKTTVMMFMILTGSTAFSQILAFTGASQGLVQLAGSADVAPIVVVIFMMLILLALGTFMEPLSIMFLTVPIYLPVITSFGYSEIWFGAIMLLNMQMASTSPPFGLQLFVMKGVAPADTKMSDIYKAALPFLGCDSVVMLLMILFPAIVLWLPGLMAG